MNPSRFRSLHRLLLLLCVTVVSAFAIIPASLSANSVALPRKMASQAAASFVQPTMAAATAPAGSAPVIISPTTASVVVNQSFNYQIVLANFESGTYAADDLAAGLALDARVGAISGAPTLAGTYAIKLTATNANGTTTSTLTLTVLPDAPPEITGSTSATTLQGNDFRYQIVATNAATSYGADGLPDGFSLDSATGLISGAAKAEGIYTVAISATNNLGTGTAVLNLNVVQAIPVVTLVADVPTANPFQGQVGRFTLARTGDDLSLPVTVVFSIKGTAGNGVDYQLLPFSKVIKAGKASKRIHINSLLTESTAPDSKKTVKLTLQPSDAYTLGDATVAKVKIFYAP